MVESSKVLRTPRTEKQTKIELFDALRQELESSVLEKASKAVQELILDQNGIGSDITETVEKVYCRLSGWDPPLFPTFNPNQRQRKREREREEIKGKEKENLDTALKKKSSMRRIQKREEIKVQADLAIHQECPKLKCLSQV